MGVKNLLLAGVFTATTLFCSAFYNPSTVLDSTGLPGDHFSLEGALEMFKLSNSPEDFEQRLNTESNYVNNLDLNQDGETDYIRVEDKNIDNGHALILQVAFNEKESQDIAVIEILKDSDESAMAQIIGDPEMYGKEVIVEAQNEYELESPASGNRGPSYDLLQSSGMWVNVWYWPCVRYMYGPRYIVWISPWRWRLYPAWWKPWKVRSWYRYNGYCAPYRKLHHVVLVHRTVVVHRNYYPYRLTSAVIRVNRTASDRAINRNNTVIYKQQTIKQQRGKTRKNNTGGRQASKKNKKG